MRISDATIESLMQSTGYLTPDQIAELKSEQTSTHRPLQDLLIRHELVSDQQLTELYATYADIPYVKIDPREVSKEALLLIPERVARQYNAVVFKVVDTVRYLAMEDPDDIQAVNFIEKQIGTDVKIHIATRENILQVLDNYRADVDKELSSVIQVQKDTGDETTETVSESDIAEDSPIAKTVNLLLEYAIRSNASDVHIEPREDYVQVRYRIDGVLQEANRLPRTVLDALISRIKILSNLKIDERRVPQDGRFKISVANHSYALRVSTLPVTDGEKVAMRILDEDNTAVSLQELGYWGQALQTVSDAITQPYGMVLVTGPTGSGKSTSLFSILTILNQQSVNISTVEDPVEYKVPGVNQTQVNPKAGMSFATGLRALLRQDPNIIMVGEIRDSETANLAVQAALTGHLVLSTLHTNNASTALPRLLDMTIEPFLIASTIRTVVGQRLVRKLCPGCREAYTPSEAQISEFTRLLGTTSDWKKIHELEKTALKEGVGDDKTQDTSSTPTTITRLWKAADQGCEECNHLGYKGRIGIYEALPNSETIQKLIVGNATSAVIQDQAIKEGMITMQIDGLIKVLCGKTTIEEILQATRE